MPDPRSLRFGLGFGVILFAALLAWLFWPSAAGAPLPDGGREEAAAPAQGPESVAGPEAPTSEGAQRTEILSKPVRLDPLPDGRPGDRKFGRFQLIDAQTRAPMPGVVLGVRPLDSWKSRVRTDPEGRFELDDSAQVGSWDLELLQPADRFATISPTAVWADPYETVQVLYHRPTEGLRVEVVGPTGVAVAGATVELARRPGDRTTHFFAFQTDDNGLLELPWPPVAGLRDGWLLTAWAGDEGSCLPAEVPEEPDPSVLLQLVPGTRLELRVSDLAGNPFPHVEVRLRSRALSRNAFVRRLSAYTGRLDGTPQYLSEQGETDWDNLPPGEYELSLRSPVGVGWLQRSLTLSGPIERIDWQLPAPTEPLALAGQLLADPEWRKPVPNHYVELTDAQSGALIMGTRTDAVGRFRLFGASSGEVVLNTMALEGEHIFPPHRHRFPAGREGVELIGEYERKLQVRLRIIDQPTSIPLEGAFLERVDGDLPVRVGRSNSQGILAAEVSPHARWQVRAPGHLRFLISLNDLPRVIRLQPGPVERD